MQFTSQLSEKAKSLGYPHSKLKVVIEYNENNSALGKAFFEKFGHTKFFAPAIYDLMEITDRGILIGNIGHLQLIEWNYVKDIY